ncbi:hypothetical protein, partial [Mycobacterium helveticum]|uniref:hypothetical protein n=1 Tax=Mycobacterium helveticum TaxID=2592811 RepID=UPI001FF064A0
MPAGGLDFDYPGFVHTVLVDMRARLARSDRPDRIFEVTLAAAKAAGLVGRTKEFVSKSRHAGESLRWRTIFVENR